MFVALLATGNTSCVLPIKLPQYMKENYPDIKGANVLFQDETGIPIWLPRRV